MLKIALLTLSVSVDKLTALKQSETRLGFKLTTLPSLTISHSASNIKEKSNGDAAIEKIAASFRIRENCYPN